MGPIHSALISRSPRQQGPVMRCVVLRSRQLEESRHDHDRRSRLRRRGAPNKSASSPLVLIADIYGLDYLPDLPEAPRARRPTGWRALTLSAPNSRTAPRQAADVHAKIKSASLPIVLITDFSGPRPPTNPQEAPVSGSGTSGARTGADPALVADEMGGAATLRGRFRRPRPSCVCSPPRRRRSRSSSAPANRRGRPASPPWRGRLIRPCPSPPP